MQLFCAYENHPHPQRELELKDKELAQVYRDLERVETIPWFSFVSTIHMSISVPMHFSFFIFHLFIFHK